MSLTRLRASRNGLYKHMRGTPIEPETVEQGLENINRTTLLGLRDYAILAVALATGRRAHELVTLCLSILRLLVRKSNG